MKNPWIKLWRNLLNDEKISFIIRRYGHDCITFWIGVLTKCEDGLLLEDEDVFADLCMLEETRYKEIRGIFLKRGLLEEEDGVLRVVNWSEYQVGESTERSRKYRAAQKAGKEEPEPSQPSEPATSCNGDATECNARATTEGEGELEGEVEKEGEGESVSSATPPVFNQNNQKPDIAGLIVADWFHTLSELTWTQATPPPKAREWAQAVANTVRGDISMALRIRAEYFTHWRDLWFAVAKGDMKKEPEKRAPDYDFRAYCLNIVSIAARVGNNAQKRNPILSRMVEPIPTMEEREAAAELIAEMAASMPFGVVMRR